MTHTETTAHPFSANLCKRVGLKPHPEYPDAVFTIPGTGWRIYDGGEHADTSPWGWEYGEADGREYGEVESLADALASCLIFETAGGGDNPGYRDITIPAIQRIIDNLTKETNA